MGIGNWGVGIGDWGFGPIPNKSSERTGYAHIAFSVGSREKVDSLTECLRLAGYRVKAVLE